VERSPITDDDLLKSDAEPVSPEQQPDGTPVMPVLKPGSIVDGRLEVQSLIASGGFGSVYKVRHLMMNKILALKTLHPVIKSDTTILRLKRESVAVSKLDHPNIVHATDFGLIDGTIPFIVMEYVEGQTLSESLKGRPPLPVEEALNLFIPLCEALAYAHDQGVIHRDIKPGNIMLSIDEKDSSRVVPKIVDFGIAKLTFGEDAVGLTLTRTGEIFGTPLYMSPEQCAGTSVDHRADIYSLGCVLFEALTGAPPVSGNSPLETMMRHASGEILSLKEASLGKEFPPDLELILAKMLAKDVRQRYQSCYEVANDLRLILRGDAAGVRTISTPGRLGESGASRQRLEPYAVALTGAIAVLAIGIACGIAIQPLLFHSNSVPAEQDPAITPTVNPNPLKINTGDNEIQPYTGFFHNDEKPDLYHFPTNLSLGKLTWANSKGKVQTIAKDNVTIPLDRKLELTASDNLMCSPTYWGGFRPTDLWGLHLTHVTVLDTEHETDDADAAIAAAWQQRNLHLLELNVMAISERAFKLIGNMNKLSCLWLMKLEIVSDSDPMKATQVTAAQIAALPNLGQLETLRLQNVKGPLTPLLHELRTTHLRRLSIWNCDNFSLEDLDAISQISSLETLEVLAELPSDRQVAAYSHLPRLRRLCILGLTEHSEHLPVVKLPRLEMLHVFAQEKDAKEMEAEYRKLIVPSSTFNWTKDLRVNENHPDHWFDPFE